MFNKTVSSIVGDLEKKCAQLLSLAEDLRATADQKHAKAETLKQERDDHIADSERAIRVAAKVKQLLD